MLLFWYGGGNVVLQVYVVYGVLAGSLCLSSGTMGVSWAVKQWQSVYALLCFWPAKILQPFKCWITANGA
jgi:hypothetical protein